jgi:hypothetical protein
MHAPRSAPRFPAVSLLLALPLILSSATCAPAEVRAADPDERALFDGRTLAGWVTTGGHHDGDAEWSVEDGAIVGRTKDGRGGLLYTDRPYTEFVLKLEARTDWPFDSGIFLRMAPRGRGAQVTLDTRDDGEIGAIYSGGFLRHNPQGARLWKKDGWNAIEVRCTGEPMRIAVQLNGAPLVDYEVPRDQAGFAPTGLIGLQVHGDRADPPRNAVRFRNIRIRELSQTPSEMIRRDERGFARLTPWGVANGWTDLLAGGPLGAFEEAEGEGGWKLEGGVLAALVAGGSQLVRTRADHRDFELRLDFKIAELANSGVFLRGDRAGGDPAWSGMEVQILDDHNWEERTRSKLAPWQFTGALYGSIAPAQRVLRPLGEWNEMTIRVQGARVATTLNGTLLYDVDGREAPVPAGKTPLDARNLEGFVGLQRHAPPGLAGEAYAWFRNVLIRDL